MEGKYNMNGNVLDLIEDLKHICENPEEYIEDMAKDKKIIGCFLEYTPIEIIHSLGLHPYCLWGEDIDIVDSGKYLPPFYCYPLQSILEGGIKGRYDNLEAVVIPALCDSLKAIGQNWKVAVENIEFIPIVYPQNRKMEFGVRFLESEYRDLIKRLEKISGREFNDADFMESTQIYNRRSLLMNKLMNLCEDHMDLITPERRHYINKSAHIMDISNHIKYIEMFIKGLEDLPKSKSLNNRVILTGIMADSPALLTALEKNGLDVAADDLAQESRQFRTTAHINTEDPLKSYCAKWADMYGCSLAYSDKKERVSMLLELAKEKNIDGIIYVNTSFCDPEEYDYPILRKAFNDNNIPHLFLQVNQGEEVNEQINTRIQGFKEILTHKGGSHEN